MDRPLLGLAIVCLLTTACYPSHRMVHDGNRYFERCYGADFNPKIKETDKELCWQAWLAHYTRHQPALRVDYAMRRVEALSGGEPPLSLPSISADVGVTQTGPQTSAELTSLHGAQDTGDEPADTDAEPVPNGCLSACNHFEHACIARCPENGTSCRRNCTRERAICLAGCH